MSNKKKPDSDAKSKPLNQLMTDLDTICERLQDSEQPLEKSLLDFEQGMKILQQAQTALAEAEQKVQIISASVADADIESADE